jgi:thymidylate synthase ThyX
MKIENFKMSGKSAINSILNDVYEINEYTIRKLLKTCNVSFLITGANRVQSMLLCESGDSYVQQSQRYVGMGPGAYCLSDEFKTHCNNAEEAIRLINKSFRLYNKMTELKDPTKKGRLTRDDFLYGVPYEDARYILPLATTTNIAVTMSGDKLLDLYTLCIKHRVVFKDLLNELSENIGGTLHSKLYGRACFFNEDTQLLNKYYSPFFNLIKEGQVVEISSDNFDDNVVIGALTSTNEKSGLDVYNSWDNKEEKTEGLINRVAFGYGHMGILEQSRTTYGMSCSLSAYHQVIRHRLQSIHPEPLYELLRDKYRNFYVPDSIKESKFYDDYFELACEYKVFLYNNFGSINDEFFYPLLLNCFYIKFITSCNARHDTFIFRERLCLTAQEEIRTMFNKKYDSLLEKSPVIYKHALPPCVYGACKEGKMTCGRSSELKEKYKKE